MAEGCFTWILKPLKGEIFSSRSGHCSILSKNQVFIFGGYDGIKCYNDLYSLTLDNLVGINKACMKLSPQGSIPPGIFIKNDLPSQLP